MSREAFLQVPFKKRVLKRSMLIFEGEPLSVLTTWDGLDNSRGESPAPLPFSTVIHSDKFRNAKLSVPTEKHATAGHEMAVGYVRAQGGQGGWRVPLWFAGNAFSNPGSVKDGWISVVVTALVVLIQTISLIASGVLWNWGWGDLFTAVLFCLYCWWLKGAVTGLRRKLREREEERREAAEKAAFDEIVGQIKP